METVITEGASEFILKGMERRSGAVRSDEKCGVKARKKVIQNGLRCMGSFFFGFARGIAVLAFFWTFYVFSPAAHAAGQAGDIVETDMLGTNVWQYNFGSQKTTTIANDFALSEFLGLHYYFVDEVRAGMAFQFTETIAPPPADGVSSFSTFALLPQVGWNFAKPFFAQLTFAVRLRKDSVAEVDLGVQAVFGASLPLTNQISGTFAVEIPYYFKLEQTIGVTPLVGIAYKL